MEGSAVEESVVEENTEETVAMVDELKVEEMTETGENGEDVGDAV